MDPKPPSTHGWIKMPSAPWEYDAGSVLGPRALVVYAAIRSLERRRSGRTEFESGYIARFRGCVVSIAELAARSGCSRATVKRSLSELESEGWIQRHGATRDKLRGRFIAIGDDAGLFLREWFDSPSSQKSEARWFPVDLWMFEPSVVSNLGVVAFGVYLAIRALERHTAARSAVERESMARWRGCVVSADRLARATGFPVRTVKSGLRTLSAAGWIRRFASTRVPGVTGAFTAVGDRDGGTIWAAPPVDNHRLAGNGEPHPTREVAHYCPQLPTSGQWGATSSLELAETATVFPFLPRSVRGRSIRDRTPTVHGLAAVPGADTISDRGSDPLIVDREITRQDLVRHLSPPTPPVATRGSLRLRDRVAAMKRSAPPEFDDRFPPDWEPKFDERIDRLPSDRPEAKRFAQPTPPAALSSEPAPPKRIDRLRVDDAPRSAGSSVDRRKRRDRELLESAQRKWREGRVGEYTADEAVVAWCYRFERELGFPDPEMRTRQQRKSFAALFVRRTTEWAGGDRAVMLQYIRETFGWWVAASKAGADFPGGLPSYAKLLRQKPDGSVSWFWGFWKLGGIERRKRG